MKHDVTVQMRQFPAPCTYIVNIACAHPSSLNFEVLDLRFAFPRLATRRICREAHSIPKFKLDWIGEDRGRKSFWNRGRSLWIANFLLVRQRYTAGLATKLKAREPGQLTFRIRRKIEW